MNLNNFFKVLLLISTMFTLTSCDNISLLNYHGVIAKKEHLLILIAFIMMLFVIVPVIFMAIYFSIKYRAENINQIYKPNWSHSKKIEIIVWMVPILIICFLAFLTWNYTHKLDPGKSINSRDKPLVIDVIALDWRWLFIYPKYHIATINEIAFPINQPILFHITSNSVMNSFFIPSLGSQVYAMPGMISTLNLISNDIGTYKGISSNYSGKGFSNMKFTVLSLSDKKKFIKWIKDISESSNILNEKMFFNYVALPNDNNFVKHFSHVNKKLFYVIFNKNIFKNAAFLNFKNH